MMKLLEIWDFIKSKALLIAGVLVGFLYLLFRYEKLKADNLQINLEKQTKDTLEKERIKKESNNVEGVANSPIKPNLKAEKTPKPDKFSL